MAQNFNKSKEELTSPLFQHNTLGEENNEVSIIIDPQDAAQMQGVAAQNSYNNYEPHEEWAPEWAIMFYAVPIEQQDAPQMLGAAPQNNWNNSMPLTESEPGSGIMSYAVLIILGVAQLLIGLHLFGVF